ACSTAFFIDDTVLSISTTAPFFMPSDGAVPTPIILTASSTASPIITLISDVPISKLTNNSPLFNLRHPLQILQVLFYTFKIRSDAHMNNSFFTRFNLSDNRWIVFHLFCKTSDGRIND